MMYEPMYMCLVIRACSHYFIASFLIRYVQECITDWLKKSNTCPHCRYELETDCATYENGRRKRMQTRVPRYPRQVLENSSIGHLRSLAADLSIAIADCLEKKDLVQRIQLSGKVEIIEVAMREYSLLQLGALSVRELKAVMSGVGVVLAADCIEKSEMIASLAQSGRILVIDDVVPPAPPSYEQEQTATAAAAAVRQQQQQQQEQQRLPPPLPPRRNTVYSSTASTATSANGRPTTTTSSYSTATAAAATTAGDREAALMQTPMSELRRLMQATNISLTGCLEKRDLVQRIIQNER